MNLITIPCSVCSGKGRKPIDLSYSLTLALFRNGRHYTFREVAEKLRISESSAHMRLQRLTDWGFLEFTEQAGRLGRLYKRTGK